MKRRNNERSVNEGNEERSLQRDYSTSTFESKNLFYLTELAIRIITNLSLQNDRVKGRDLAKIMIGFERMGVEWQNILPDELSGVLSLNMDNLDARGLSNVLWSLGSLYAEFDELSSILKVSP